MEQITKIEASQATANVVENDVKLPGIPVQVPAVSMLAEMESKRIAWETGVYRTSNQALYAVLADCLAYSSPLETVRDHKARVAALDSFYKERGYRMRKDTPLVTRVVRAVFGDADRRRISTYSLVLRQAKKKDIQPTELADWIERNHGIQEIRLSQSDTFVSPKQKAESAQEKMGLMPNLAVIKSEALSILADPDFIHEQCVLLATQQPDGTFAVKALLRGGAVTAAYTALYSQLNTQTKTQKAERVAANDADGATGQVA